MKKSILGLMIFLCGLCMIGFIAGKAGKVLAAEVFEEANRPGLEYDAAGDFFLVKPWNYEKDFNAYRKYPLLIYLHGSSQTKYLKNLYYMGMGYYDLPAFDHEYQKVIADEFRQTYPCFTYVPQGPSGWDTAKLIAQIEQLKTNYRIDADRIYLHGFSMGGWGAYSLANAYYDYNGQLFAGIIHLSGTGVTIRDQIAAHTRTWFMAGLLSPADISAARNAYNFLKNHAANAGSTETSAAYTIVTGHEGEVFTLIKNGKDMVKRTEFTNDGHFTTEFPFRDPYVMSWLFGNSPDVVFNGKNFQEVVKAYPNPWKPDSLDGKHNQPLISFAPVPSKAKIWIYDMSSELVYTFVKNGGLNSWSWNGTNQAGRKVVAGVYFYLIVNSEDTTQKAKGKIVIIR